MSKNHPLRAALRRAPALSMSLGLVGLSWNAAAASFGAPHLLAAGDSPRPVLAADLNGDGLPDLVTVNYNSNNVSVLLGKGKGAFAARKNFEVGTYPDAVAVADLNGDGRPDLIVANYQDGTVSVLLNTTPKGAGTPSFAAQQTLHVGAGPRAVAVADFNGDARPDLVVANFSDNSLSLLLNTTPAKAAGASFAAQQKLPGGTGPKSVAAVDLNGDGLPDLAVADISSSNLALLMNSTAHGANAPDFAAPVLLPVGRHPGAVAAADLNGDGRPDLVLSNESDATVSVLLNTTAVGAATAGFAERRDFAAGEEVCWAAVADLDGDGKPDIVAANSGGDTVSLLLNTTAVGAAAASFAPQQVLTTGAHPHAVAAADFNGDGRIDLAVSNSADNNLAVLLNGADAAHAAAGRHGR
ncbi:MAG: VCBS repeat-containing protein [Nevskia sp.]|nr:VCBS repeat-containing protein [Nevskia sp.]